MEEVSTVVFSVLLVFITCIILLIFRLFRVLQLNRNSSDQTLTKCSYKNRNPNQDILVIIVGAGPAGLATAACLGKLKIPSLILEKEDCHSSLWRKRAYDRLKLHLAKEFCELPHQPFRAHLPTFVPKDEFIQYLDDYVLNFDLKIRYNSCVEDVFFDESFKKWHIVVKTGDSNLNEVYLAQFLVVASGENDKGIIPEILGLSGFEGKLIHSNKYKNGREFSGEDVLVVGCGNSGMEIAFDLSTYGAKVSIVARSPVHIVTREAVYLGMKLLRYFPSNFVDKLVLILCQLKFGDTSKYGIERPEEGPFSVKEKTGRSPTIDVGAMEKIKSKEIRVLPPITSISGREITFKNGKTRVFNAIIFATGYKSNVLKWLKDGYDLFTENGMPKEGFPNHWKGKNGIYSAGFSNRGLMGISSDARKIAEDIDSTLSANLEN